MNKAADKAIKTTYVSIFGNTVLAVVKGAVGFFGNSYALIADAIESLTDVLSSFLVLLGLRYARRPADSNHPYGHGKAEPLATFAVVGFLLIAATTIAFQSIVNIQTPQEAPQPFTLWVLAGIILVKEILYRFVKNRGRSTKSTALKADAWHHRSDALTSLMAFIGIAISQLFDGFEAAEDWAALLASLFIIYNAYMIFRPALGEIMDEHLHDHLIEDIRQICTTVEGVKGSEKCFVRKSGFNYHVDLHMEVDANISVRQGHEIAHRLKDILMDRIPELTDVLIHIEPHEN